VIVPRELEQRTMWSSSLFFFFLFVQRVMIGKPTLATEILLAAMLIWALFSCGQYLLEMRKQVREGAYINMPAFGFWLLAVWGFLPLGVLGTNFGDAYLITTIVHWFQYLGLNYILVRNKYKSDDQIHHLPARHPFLLFVGVCLFLFGINLILSVASKEVKLGTTVHEFCWSAGIGIALCHFFLDAFIWRFREPYQREAVLPYLKVR